MVEDHYEMDFPDLEQKLKDNVKMMILCSPHNPVSRVWKQAELQKVAELCLKNNVILISDEIHSDIIFSKNTHIPIPTISSAIADKSIAMFAPSKTFNLAGLSLSYLVIPNKMIRTQFQKTLRNLGLHLGNLFGIEALEAAYRYGDEWLNLLLTYLEANYDLTRTYLREHIPRIKPIRMDGTYLLWLNCRNLNLKHDELIKLFIDEAQLALNDGSIFGQDGSGFMRMNIACPRIMLETVLKNLEKAVKKRA